MQDDEVDTMRKLTIAALMVASMAGSSVALAGNPTLEAHKDSAKTQYSQTKDGAKSQYSQTKDGAKSAAQTHKATASSKVSDKTSHATQAAKSAKTNASHKASDTQSRYQKKSYADVLKNERH